MSDVFVSYKAEDRRRVKPLVEALQADGYSVWWDEQIGGGATWRHAIEAELNAAKCVIVIWSKRSVGEEGTFVQDEATRAQQRHVYVPVLIDKVHLPLGFGETQALSLVGWKGDRSDNRYQAVLAAVRRIAGSGTGTAAAAAISSAPVSRRAVLAGSGVAVVAVAGIGAWELLKPSAGADSDSIAVLPFANLSGDPAQAYFSDGIAEEIRSALARLGGLTVIGRTSSEAVRNDDAPTAAKKLAVANILTGSVRQSPSTIRITAELIDGKTGADRWSQDYDRAPGDAIKIQSDIAENVASALSSTLAVAARAVITAGETTDPQARQLYLQAKSLAYELTRPADEQAVQLLDGAITLDPNYALAYALKALMVLGTANEYASSSQQLAEERGQALLLARKALAIAPNLPIGHGALAEIYRSNLELAPAAAEFKRVMALAPSDPDALRSFAFFTSEMGNLAEGLRISDRVVALDPLNSNSYGSRAGIRFWARRYSEAVADLEKLKRNSPQLFNSPIILGHCLQMVGRAADAAESYSQAPRDDPFRIVGEAALAARSDDRNGALLKLKRLKQLYGEGASYQYGEVHALLGETDAAFAALEHAWQVKDGGLLMAKVDPWLDPIRSDPRYPALLRRVGFPA